jgi:predicted RND superfamily exporter protein
MPRSSHRLHRRLLIAMLWVVTHPKKTLAIGLLALLACGVYAFTNLGISTNQDELFSSKVAFFGDYIDFTKDFPENQASYVMVEATDPAHPPATTDWIAVANAITDRLKNDKTDVKSVDSHAPLEQLGSQGILFQDPNQVKQDFTDFQQLSIPFRPTNFLNRSLGPVPVARFFNALSRAKPTTQSAEFAGLIARGMSDAVKNPDAQIQLGKQVPDLAELGATDPSRLGYYYVEDQEQKGNHLLLIRVFEQDNFSQKNGLANAIDGIRQTIAQAAAPFKQFKVALTGRPALEADEMATTDRDARRSEIAALSAVFIGLVLLLRSFWMAIVAEFALLVGIGWTFGWATLTVHRLNLLSMVFLIALTGIGMDYLIQVLTRYRRESARRSSPRGIWTGVFKYVAAPINTACLGAAGAFFVSVLTNFRGAAELGIVASGGLLLCLLTGYIILPPLLTLFPAKPRLADAERSSDCEDRLANHAPKPISRWRNLWLAPPFVWAILLLCGIHFAREAKFDPSLLKMQAQSLQSVQLIHKLQTWSAVVLVPPTDLETLRKVRDAVEKLPSVEGTESILTAYDNDAWLSKQQAAPIPDPDYDPVKIQDLPAVSASALKLAKVFQDSSPGVPRTAGSDAVGPGSPGYRRTGVTDAAQSLENLASAINQSAPSIAAARLSGWQQVFIQQLKDQLAQFRPTPLDVAALPASLRSHLIGNDGKIALYINPKDDLWKQSNLAAFVNQVESAVGKIPNAPAPTGIAINVYHSTSSIEGSFYHATGYALCLIFVLVLIDLKDLRQTLLAISVLAMGLPMLIALMGLFHVDWNFANFFGLPILIGAGHEYGVFMVHRYNEAHSDCHRRWRAWDVSDKALLLCGYVTSVSFGFFWLLGHHEGLKSLGLVMALGTACIYLATLCVLRPLLLWKLGQRAPASAAFSEQRETVFARE